MKQKTKLEVLFQQGLQISEAFASTLLRTACHILDGLLAMLDHLGDVSLGFQKVILLINHGLLETLFLPALVVVPGTNGKAITRLIYPVFSSAAENYFLTDYNLNRPYRQTNESHCIP